jgi:hypothetical protein
MTKSAGLDVAVFATAALAVGWFASRARIAHGDLLTRLGQIPRLRAERNRTGGIAAAVALIALMVLYILAKHHHHG